MGFFKVFENRFFDRTVVNFNFALEFKTWKTGSVTMSALRDPEKVTSNITMLSYKVR